MRAQDCCHPGVVQQYGPAQFFALAKIHAIIRKVDPYHLVFGTVACRVMWMWKDSYGSSGLGLDVTMAEAYVRPPPALSSLSVSGLLRSRMPESVHHLMPAALASVQRHVRS